MIPIRDINPTIRRPVVSWSLIAINVVCFLIEVLAGPDGMQGIVMRYGLVPDVLLHGDFQRLRSEGGALGALVTPFTSMFLHGGWMHLIGNMWFLHVFGDNVEDELGRGRFLGFYLLCGLGAALGQALIDPGSRVPMVGASGAISGVLAGYVMLHARAPVVTLVPLLFFFTFIELPAFLFIFVWFGLQVVNATVSLGPMSGGGGGVAWFAHVGGFLAGLALVRLFRARRPRPPGPRRIVFERVP